MTEEEGLAFYEVGQDVRVVNFWNFGVRSCDENDIRFLNRFGGVTDFETVFLGHRTRLRFCVKTDDDFASAVFEVESVGVSL